MDGSCYLVNASSWMGPLNIVLPVYGFIMPILMFITFFSNSVIIIVLSRFNLQLYTVCILINVEEQAQHEVPHQHSPTVHGSL